MGMNVAASQSWHQCDLGHIVNFSKSSRLLYQECLLPQAGVRTCPKKREAGGIAPGSEVRHSRGGMRFETLLASSILSAYRGASAINSSGHQDTRGNISYPGEVLDRETSRHIREVPDASGLEPPSDGQTDRHLCIDVENRHLFV